MTRAPRQYTDAEAIRYERIHSILDAHIGNLDAALAALNKEAAQNNSPLAGENWSLLRLERLVETDTYQAWKVSYKNLLKNHAEIRSYQFIANASSLPPNIQANIAIAVAKGDIKGAFASAARNTLKAKAEPDEDGEDFSETADLIGAYEDDANPRRAVETVPPVKRFGPRQP